MWGEAPYRTRYMFLHSALVLQRRAATAEEQTWEAPQLRTTLTPSQRPWEGSHKLGILPWHLKQLSPSPASIPAWPNVSVQHSLSTYGSEGYWKTFEKVIPSPSVTNSWWCLLKLMNAFLALFERNINVLLLRNITWHKTIWFLKC